MTVYTVSHPYVFYIQCRDIKKISQRSIKRFSRSIGKNKSTYNRRKVSTILLRDRSKKFCFIFLTLFNVKPPTTSIYIVI